MDAKRREADRAAGALNQLLGRLKDEFGVGTVEEAEALLRKLTMVQAKAEASFDSALGKFKEKWKEKLDGNGQ